MQSPQLTPRRSKRIAAASPEKRFSIVDVEKQQEELVQLQEEKDQRVSPLVKTKKQPNPRGRKRGNKRKKDAIEQQEDEAEIEAERYTLIDVIRDHQNLVPAMAKKWIEEYGGNLDLGMAELWTLIVWVAGVETNIREEEIGVEVERLVNQMAQTVKKRGLHISMSGRNFKSIKDATMEIIDKIIHRASQNNLLYNNHLLDTLLMLLTQLSLSPVRQFRYVSTSICMEIAIACVKVMAELTAAQDTAQRQLSAEERKRQREPDRFDSSVCDALHEQIDQLHEKRSQLKAWIEGAFQRVFTHRSRDCSEDIRVCVIDGIGEWIRDLPSEYLNETHLRHVAWALSDKSPKVRLVTLHKLQDLYSEKNHHDTRALHEFTKRFCERFRELVFDVDDEVAVQGIRLVTTLVGLNEMGEEDVRDIYWVLVDENVKLRHAASKLAGHLMTTQGEQELERIVQLTPLRPGKCGSYTKQQKQLAGLLHMMKLLSYTQDENSSRRNSSIQERPLNSEFVRQLVDALFSELSILTQWNKLCEMILAEDACYHWGNPAITNLIHVLEHSLEQAKNMTIAKSKNVAAAGQQHIVDATMVLMVKLPEMLRNFSADEEKVCSLVKVVRNMHIPLYSQKKQEKEYEELLGLVSSAFFKQKDESVLQECAATLEFCAQVGPEILTDIGRHVLGSVVEQCAVKFFTASQDVEALPQDSLSEVVTALESGTGSDDDIYALQLALRRVQALLLWCGGLLERADAYDAMNGLLADAASSSERYMGTTITCLLLKNMQLMLMWGLHHVGSEHSNEQSASQLKQSVQRFIQQQENLFDLYPGSSTIRETVMQVWLECCCLFSAQKLVGTQLQEVAYEPRLELVLKYWHFCQTILEEIDTRDLEEEDTAEAQNIINVRQSIQNSSQLSDVVENNLHDNNANLPLKVRIEIRKKKVLRKLDLIKGFGRLVLAELVAEDTRWWIFSRMTSIIGSHGNEYVEAIKAVQQHIRKSTPGIIPQLFAEAMKAAYEKLIRIEDNADLWNEFERLCYILSNYYRGLSSEGNQVYRIVEYGIEYGVQNAPSHFEFLYSGIAYFVSKIPSKDVDSLVQQVTEHVDSLGITKDSSEDYLPLLEFQQRLQQHAAKVKAPRKGGLRTVRNQNKSTNQKVQFEDDKENEEEDLNQAADGNIETERLERIRQVHDDVSALNQLLGGENEQRIQADDGRADLPQAIDTTEDQGMITSSFNNESDPVVSRDSQRGVSSAGTAGPSTDVDTMRDTTGDGRSALDIDADLIITQPSDMQFLDALKARQSQADTINSGLQTTQEQLDETSEQQATAGQESGQQASDGFFETSGQQATAGQTSGRYATDGLLESSGLQGTAGQTSGQQATAGQSFGDTSNQDVSGDRRKRKHSESLTEGNSGYSDEPQSTEGTGSDDVEPPAKWAKRRRGSVPQNPK